MGIQRVTGQSITPIQKWRRKLARAAWLLIAAVTMIVILLSTPDLYRWGQTMCSSPMCEEDLTALTPAGAAFLATAGVSLQSYALLTTALYLASALVFCGVATLIFLRSSDRIAYLVSLALLLIGGQYFFTLNTNSYWFLLNATHNYLLFVTLILGFYLFPSGRFVPNWSRWVAMALFVTEFFYSYFPDAPFSPHNFFPPLEMTIWVGALLLIPVTQFYRFIVVSTPVERQQTKWVVGGLLITLLGILLLLGANAILPPELEPLARLVASPLIILSLLAIPLSLAVAMLRYRLWDIDVIIRKTLIYGVLSGLLVLIYWGIVVVLQGVFEAVSDHQSPIAVVISTLAMAGLFAPLRRRVQALIDRRFYRKKYDVQQVLAQFTQTARDEVSLETLTAELTRVVQESLQPEDVGVWLTTMPRQTTGSAQSTRA